MDAQELARWTRFAAKGGVGKCTAVVDCIAQEMGEDLMFLKDDEITVLMQLSDPGFYLGHCEGVVGRFSGKDVRFHSKLKKPVMTKRGSVNISNGHSESRVSISLVDGSPRADTVGPRSRRTSESPSNSRPASRAKQSPSPALSKSHARLLSYSTSYSRYSDDRSPPSGDTTVVGSSLHTFAKSGHAKHAGMAVSVSGASIFSVGSIYSEASTATSVYSAANAAFHRSESRNGSMHSTDSGGTERDVPGDPEYVNGDQTFGSSDSHQLASPLASTSTPDKMLSTSTSTLTSTSTSDASFPSTSTSSPNSVNDSFGSIGSISELEAKQFDTTKLRSEAQTGFILIPPPLELGNNNIRTTSPVVAPLRVSKPPRLTPSPGLPPSSPLPVPPVASGDHPRSTIVSPVLPNPLSPGIPVSLSTRPPTSSSHVLPGSLSPGFPGSLTPGQHSPGLPGSLSPGFRSPTFLQGGVGAQSQYTFGSGSGSGHNSPNPRSSLPSPYSPSSPSALSSPHNTATKSNAIDSSVGLTPPSHTRTPPVSLSPFGSGQAHSAPLSPPPSSPLPPLPSVLSSSSSTLPVPGSRSVMGTAATAAASGRTSPLTALSSSLPSSTSKTLTLYPNDRFRRDDRDQNGRDDGALDEEVEEGDTTRLSTLDAFRRQLDDEVDEAEHGVEVEGERSIDGKRRSGGDEDAQSDGELGIGLSLMGALGEEDEDEDDVNDAGYATKIRGGNCHGLGAGDIVGLGINDKNVPGEDGSATAITWTRYEPSSPISAQDPSRHSRMREDGTENGDEEEDDDGAYWDDIYDDYRYSRYSLASKRISILSKASGASKASSKARAPPIPFPPDRPGFDARRPSVGSDGTNGYVRPSFESGSSSRSGSTPLARPSLSRSMSNESTHRSNTLPLTAQFPAVPMHVPVRTESRLRIVHDGFMQGGDDHGERELQVEHGSTEGDTGAVGFNIEITQEEDSQGQEVDVARHVTLLNANTTLSPLLHTTFGSPHSSRFTDFEDGSDQDHGRRHSNKSGQSGASSAEGPPSGGTASALRTTMEAERATSSATSSTTPASALSSNRLPNHEPAVLATPADDEGHITGTDISVDETVSESEVPSSLPKPTCNMVETTVVTGPIQGFLADLPEDGEKSSFLRPRPQPNQSPHPFARTSMFLPHPNAPKAVYQSPGPMYGRTTTQTYAQSPPLGNGSPGNTTMAAAPMLRTPPGTTFFSTHIFHQLRGLSVMAPPGAGLARRPPMTVFARCHPELNASMGPVPILFSLDPFPPLVSAPSPGTQVKVGNGGMSKVGCMESMMPMRAATVSAPVRRGVGDNVPLREPGAGTSVGTGTGDLPTLRLPKRSATAVGSAGPSSPIPREGFVPQVGAARPRSRSFSAFGDHPSPDKSVEEPAMKMPDVVPVSAPPRKSSFPPALMPRHALPSLVLQITNKDREPDESPVPPNVPSPAQSTPSNLPPSPLNQEPIMTHSPQLADTNPLMLNTNVPLASPALSSPFANSSDKDKDASPISYVTGRTSVSTSDPRAGTSPQSLMPGRQSSLDEPRNSSVEGLPRQSSDSSESPSLASPPPIPEATSQAARSSPPTQELAVKTKLSLPALRMKASTRSRVVDDAVSVASFPTSAENETVQVQDMDFELVKPSLPPVTGRVSQDSTLTSREADSAKPDVSPITCDAASTLSHAPRSPLVPTPSTESAESIDAHRQRELKWMALFPTVPPSQARKNKKVRKLLQDGVPSSVRYLVWCHLTDSKARALPGVYTKLGKRPPVPVFAEIEKNALEGFPDQPQLHKAQGPLVSLLQAYLSMVPDIQYNSGLTLIAGHLLLLAPEEDAFWIFASMMDAHLRTYFATNTLLIEIDASLFSKALETIDPVLSKKLYMQLSIAPASITRPWFSTLFVGSLSVDHLHRVWDVFLYDGIPFLYRVGLVVVNCVRHLLLQATTEEAVLAHLARPPPACLPSATEMLVLAAGVKLKDNDVRKQRAKMEQQLKKTTQARPPDGMTNVQTATISLPKT